MLFKSVSIKSLLILVLLIPSSLLAQKRKLFEYTVLKDSIPFDVEKEKLSYADSNSTIKIMVNPNPKLSKSVTWNVSKVDCMVKLDNKMLASYIRYSDSPSLRLLGNLAKSSKVMRDKQLSHQPGLIIHIQEVTGIKNKKSKSIKTSKYLVFKLDEGVK